MVENCTQKIKHRNKNKNNLNKNKLIFNNIYLMYVINNYYIGILPCTFMTLRPSEFKF